MGFGPSHPDLMQGARNAVATCLAIEPHERVTLIADQASHSVAASLLAALAELGASCEAIVVEEAAPRPWTTTPARVLEALETTDVGILCIRPQPGELPSRMEMVGIVERRQLRYAHM